jgi:hypothetical protein
MPRTYAVSFEQIAISSAQDLLQIKGATGKMLRVLRIWVAATDTTAPTNQQLSLRARFLPATVTDGSGGSSATPRPMDPGDAAASFTCLINNTVKATTSGTAAILEENACNVFSGYDYMFPRPPVVGPSESMVFELLSTVTGTVHASGGALVEEMGG